MITTGFAQHGICSKKLWSYLASFVALSKVINLDSIVNRVIHVYFVNSHDTTPPPMVNTYLLVDSEFFMSDIQFI